MTRIRLSSEHSRRKGLGTRAMLGTSAVVCLVLIACTPLQTARAQMFAQESGDVPIGTFELQGQGLAVDPSPAAGQAPVSEEPDDSSSRLFLQRFELSLRESKEARQAALDEAEGELKNGRASAGGRSACSNASSRMHLRPKKPRPLARILQNSIGPSETRLSPLP